MQSGTKRIVFIILLIIILFIFFGGFSKLQELIFEKRISKQEIEELRKDSSNYWDAEVQDIERLEREIGEKWRGRE